KVFSGREIDITGLSLTMEPGSLLMDYGMDEEGGSLRMKGAIDLDLMEAETCGDYCLLRGKIRGDADMSWSDGVISSLSGFMDCEDAKLCYRDSFLDINGPVKLGKRRLTTDRLSIGYGDSQMDISGVLFIDKQLHFTGALAIDGVTVDEKDKSITKELEGLSADATLKLTNIKYHGIPIDDASAKLTLGAGRLCLDKMVVHALSGVAEGKASIEDNGGTDFDINVLFKNTDLEQFLDAISPGKAKINGTMNLKGRLWGNTNSINGDLVFRAREGTIAKYYLISKMFKVLNVYKIVKKKKIDLLSEGFSYDRIKSSFEIRNGVMKFDDFHFASDSVQMSVVGEYSLRKREVDAVAGVQPLETLGRIVSSVPLLGWVMTGEDRKLLVVMFKIRGDIEDPAVVPQPVNTLSNSVRGIVLRSMKLPSELITNPENVIK
ncbi:MAG: AsmA-like C-terminal region-containing protein, partial [Thermodesulfobacteriota bacterium]|nr:AsmA-like C-terminal region-containing protein [Thermodesulfobacteriota bacterium]